MTELQAALGLSQMTRLDEFVSHRNRISEHYDSALAPLPLSIVRPLDNSISGRHLYVIRLQQPEKRRALFDELRQQGIQVHVHYFPVHLQPFYMGLGFKEGDFPNAEHFYKAILTLPLFPTLSDVERDYICSQIARVI